MPVFPGNKAGIRRVVFHPAYHPSTRRMLKETHIQRRKRGIIPVSTLLSGIAPELVFSPVFRPCIRSSRRLSHHLPKWQAARGKHRPKNNWSLRPIFPGNVSLCFLIFFLLNTSCSAVIPRKETRTKKAGKKNPGDACTGTERAESGRFQLNPLSFNPSGRLNALNALIFLFPQEAEWSFPCRRQSLSLSCVPVRHCPQPPC